MSKDLQSKEHKINDQITDPEVRVIGTDGEQLGIMSSDSARKLAASYKLDLVKIADKAQPPVCKIINYGKYKFEMAKKEKESRKKQHIVEIKEIRLSLNIDTNDLETKLRNAKKFIEHGDKVKVSIRFRGRELGHPEIGYDMMNRFLESCSEFANVEKPPKLDGRSMLMFLVPKPVTKSKAPEVSVQPTVSQDPTVDTEQTVTETNNLNNLDFQNNLETSENPDI